MILFGLTNLTHLVCGNGFQRICEDNNYKDYVITHTITNDKMEYRSSNNDLGLDLRGNPYEAKYEYDIKTKFQRMEK